MIDLDLTLEDASAHEFADAASPFAEALETSAVAGDVVSKEMDTFYLCDQSGSMEGAKIESLNNGLRDVNAALRSEAAKHPRFQLYLRAISFNGDARWHQQRTPLESFQWQDLTPGGQTNFGAAYELLADALQDDVMPEQALIPTIILMSDGKPNRPWEEAFDRLRQLFWFEQATRVPIAIGQDADRDLLAHFASDGVQVYDALSAKSLVKLINFASVGGFRQSVAGGVRHTVSKTVGVATSHGIAGASATANSPIPDVLAGKDEDDILFA